MKEVEPRTHAIFFSGWLSPVKAFALGSLYVVPRFAGLQKVSFTVSSTVSNLIVQLHFLISSFSYIFLPFFPFCFTIISWTVFSKPPHAWSSILLSLAFWHAALAFSRGGRSGCCSSGHGAEPRKGNVISNDISLLVTGEVPYTSFKSPRSPP